MTLLLRLCLFGGLAWGASEAALYVLGSDCGQPEGVRGTYVEGRSASVFAGACHVNGEAAAQGRHALLAWRIDEGQWNGIDLAGVEVAATLAAAGSLDGDPARRARLWIDARDDAQRAATRAWLDEQHGATLGEIVAVAEGPIDFAVEGETFDVTVPGALRLSGQLEPDRACCTMPEQVWFDPLARVGEPIVGLSEVCRFEGAEDDVPWSYPGQNNAFVASFADAPAPAAAREVAPCCSQP